MSDDWNERKLLSECISGSREAWDIFVRRYSKLVYHAISKTLNLYNAHCPQEDIEDLYNSLFLALIENNNKKLKQFEGKNDCTLSSWIRLITVRRTIDFLRGQKPMASLDEEDEESRSLMGTIPDRSPSADDQLELSESENLIQEAVEELPSSDKLFMELYYRKELSPEEIAGILNVSVSTVYSKKNRVREKLKKILKDKGFIA